MICPQCKAKFICRSGDENRAKKLGAPRYCGRVCAGLARRAEPKSVEQRKAEKAAYDREYRGRNQERLKAEKAEWYQRNRDPEKEREYRKARMQLHVEYCRRPEYKAWKIEYDKRRNEQEYADYAEAWRLLQELEREVRSRASAYECRVQNGYYTRNAQKRRRELWQAMKSKNSTPRI